MEIKGLNLYLQRKKMAESLEQERKERERKVCELLCIMGVSCTGAIYQLGVYPLF